MINDPAGFPSTTPWITQPLGGGWGNPGVAWLGSDSWGILTPGESLAAVSRALELIAGSIGALPWKVRRGTEDLPVPAWLEDPQVSRPDARMASASLAGFDTRMSPVAFREQLVSSVVMHGDAFVLVPSRDASGAPQAPVFLLNPLDVTLRDGGYWVASERLPSGSIVHIRGRAPHTPEGRGLGVIDAHAKALGLLSSAQAQAQRAMDAPIPAGVLEVTPGYTVDKDEANELRTDWEAMHRGRFGVGVLNATVTFKPLQWSPESLQLIAMAEFGLRNVALAFGLSPSWFGVEDTSLTYSTTMMRASELRTFSLLTWVRRIESAIDAELPRGTGLSIVLDGLERGTTSERYAAYATAVSGGWMTPDEVRELEGWAPTAQEGPVEPTPPQPETEEPL